VTVARLPDLDADQKPIGPPGGPLRCRCPFVDVSCPTGAHRWNGAVDAPIAVGTDSTRTSVPVRGASTICPLPP